MSQEEEAPRVSHGHRRMGWQRILLWTLFVVLGGACLWMWWAMGRIQEAVDKQGKGTPQNNAAQEQLEGKP